MKIHPPRLAEWLMARSLARRRAEREAVLGDLAEEHGAIADARGRRRARAWYWAQAIRSLAPNLGRRLALDGQRRAAIGLGPDVRLALRGLRRRPGFSLSASLTLALGIGATASVFSVVDATVIRAIRVPDPDRVVALWSQFERYGTEVFELSAAEFTDVRSDVRSFSHVGAWYTTDVLLGADDWSAARTIDVAFTSGDIHAIVGARTVAGRLPARADDAVGASRVAVISHAFWIESFGGSADVVGGRSLRFGSLSVPIVGVLAQASTLPGTPVDAWVHTPLDPASWATNRSGHGLIVLARLAPGATVESARDELSARHEEWAQRYAGQHSFGLDGHTVHAATIADRMLGTARRTGAVLLFASGLLLLLACANLANLFMARGETRTSEVGVRMALGASARRVAQPVLLEGLALAGLGGAFGLALASAGLPALLRLAPAEIAAGASAAVDARVAAFAVTMSLASGLVFAAVPAWAAARRPPSGLLRGAVRGGTRTSRGLGLLVAAQMALATVLVAGAMLVAASLRQLNTVDPGLTPDARLTFDLTLPPARYGSAAAVAGFYDAVADRLRALPGVGDAAAVRVLPLRDPLRRENVLREGEARPEDRVPVSVQAATPGALRVLGIRLIAGREFTDADRIGAPRVALVNRTAARTLWPGEVALGRRIVATFLPPSYGPVAIVGIYDDVRSGGLAAGAGPEIVLPIAQAEGWTGWARNLTVVVMTRGPAPGVGDLRAAVREIDPGVALDAPASMTEIVYASAARERFLAALLAVFSALALAIAAVGVFGVVSFSVARQSREFAIRHALGAKRVRILGAVLARTARLAGIGGLAGIVAVAVLSPALGAFLYNVSPRDPAVLAGAPAVLLAIALLAAMAPAVRATRVPLARVLQDSE